MHKNFLFFCVKLLLDKIKKLCYNKDTEKERWLKKWREMKK